MPLPQGTVLIAGVGPGLGAALARRFAAAGTPVALGARTPEVLEEIADDIGRRGQKALALPYDVTEEAEVDAAIELATDRLGPVRTLVYNAGNRSPGDIDEITPEAFARAWRVGAYGAFLHVRRLVPAMAEAGGGVVLVTGATSSVHAPAGSPAFGSAKFGLRGLAMSLARSWGPKGVHVCHILVDGVILTPGVAERVGTDDPGYLRTEAVAEVYHQLATQPASAWTFELDLRPHTDDHFEN